MENPSCSSAAPLRSSHFLPDTAVSRTKLVSRWLEACRNPQGCSLGWSAGQVSFFCSKKQQEIFRPARARDSFSRPCQLSQLSGLLRDFPLSIELIPGMVDELHRFKPVEPLEKAFEKSAP